MRRAAVGFTLCFVVMAFVYRSVPTAFLRAESGYYLRVAQSDSTAQRNFRRQLFTQSQNGHYTPLFFAAELKTAGLFGTRRDLWRWRQIVGLAVYGAAALGALASLAGTLRKGRERVFIAAAVAALAIFQPYMADFVSWPFMIAQLAWLALLMVALFAIVKMATRPAERQWAWIAVAASSVSLQISGLGFVTVGAVGAVLIGLLWHERSATMGDLHHVRPRDLIRATILLGCVAAVQAWLTFHFLPPAGSSAATPAVHHADAVKLLLGFVFNFACAGVRTFSLTSTAGPSVLAIAYCWPLGLLLVAGVGVATFRMLRRKGATLSSGAIAIATVAVFSVAGFFTLLAMIAAREISDAPDSGGLVPYFNFFTVTPRYLIPLQALLLGPATLLLTWSLRKFSRRSVSVTCIAVVLAAILTQIEFQHGPMKSLLPGTRVSHFTTWRLLLRSAQECRAARLPLPNLPLGAVSGEMAADVQSFLPMLRHDLGLTENEKLETLPWPLPADISRGVYASVPSLSELEQKLDLTPRQE